MPQINHAAMTTTINIEARDSNLILVAFYADHAPTASRANGDALASRAFRGCYVLWWLIVLMESDVSDSQTVSV
jgi:hypothetical protein